MKLGRIFNCFETLLTQWAMNLELHELNDFVIRYLANKEVNRAETLRRKGQFFFLRLCVFASPIFTQNASAKQNSLKTKNK